MYHSLFIISCLINTSRDKKEVKTGGKNFLYNILYIYFFMTVIVWQFNIVIFLGIESEFKSMENLKYSTCVSNRIFALIKKRVLSNLC